MLWAVNRNPTRWNISALSEKSENDSPVDRKSSRSSTKPDNTIDWQLTRSNWLSFKLFSRVVFRRFFSICRSSPNCLSSPEPPPTRIDFELSCKAMNHVLCQAEITMLPRCCLAALIVLHAQQKSPLALKFILPLESRLLSQSLN